MSIKEKEMQDVNSKIKSIERAINFGEMELEDLSPGDRKLFDAYLKEKHQESVERNAALENEKNQRFSNSMINHLPTGSKNIKPIGGNWFSFELENKKYVVYYFYQMNSTTPIFSSLTQI